MSNSVQEWDSYWSAKKSRVLYDIIAEFYRRFIIRPYLNAFIKKYFQPGQRVLHAGCGSGQVDKDIRQYVVIEALDVSAKALEIYKRENGQEATTIQGSIFQIPVSDQHYDGVYNLGVMEHFTEEEIQKILIEFKRVLKKGGSIILFWPPEYGASVIFFKGLRKVLWLLTRKNHRFHPDEICRVRSKNHIKKIAKEANLTLVEYSFGMGDFFTYSVVVLS